jgi:hypothetical protein
LRRRSSNLAISSVAFACPDAAWSQDSRGPCGKISCVASMAGNGNDGGGVGRLKQKTRSGLTGVGVNLLQKSNACVGGRLLVWDRRPKSKRPCNIFRFTQCGKPEERDRDCPLSLAISSFFVGWLQLYDQIRPMAQVLAHLVAQRDRGDLHCTPSVSFHIWHLTRKYAICGSPGPAVPGFI